MELPAPAGDPKDMGCERSKASRSRENFGAINADVDYGDVAYQKIVSDTAGSGPWGL
jgi:hypothetical protein